jgi:hypothetical protein
MQTADEVNVNIEILVLTELECSLHLKNASSQVLFSLEPSLTVIVSMLEQLSKHRSPIPSTGAGTLNTANTTELKNASSQSLPIWPDSQMQSLNSQKRQPERNIAVNLVICGVVQVS